jgi:pilus assembly protein CpaB
MSRARRSALLIGLALILGSLAAADVSRREAALRARLGPVTERVVAARDLPAGRKLRLRDLAVRRLPERYAPPDAASSPAELAGQRLAVPATAGGYVGVAQVRIGGAGAPVRAGERTTELIAVGSPEWVVPGARVDVLVTRERGDGGPAGAELALEDVEVLDARPVSGDDTATGNERVAATLRVGVRQAVYLASAQAFAREIRLLPRAPGDRERVRG